MSELSDAEDKDEEEDNDIFDISKCGLFTVDDLRFLYSLHLPWLSRPLHCTIYLHISWHNLCGKSRWIYHWCEFLAMHSKYRYLVCFAMLSLSSSFGWKAFPGLHLKGEHKDIFQQVTRLVSNEDVRLEEREFGSKIEGFPCLTYWSTLNHGEQLPRNYPLLRLLWEIWGQDVIWAE